MDGVSLPDFIDNIELKLCEVLDRLLRQQPQADIASGYFNLGGFELVKESLKETKRLRLLLAKALGGDGALLYPAGFEKDLASTKLTEQNRKLARELAELLMRPEVEVRLYTQGLFHGKAYIFDDIAIIGSSNFTRAGLTGNTELNSVHKQKYAAQAARQWFERFWNQAEEYKGELVRLLEESKLISSGYSPFLIFLKSLYEYFKDELTVDLERGRDIGKSLVDLADFQQKAFERAVRILGKYDGVFIADSVGLGKTWIGKKLFEHYGYFQRKRCLVIAPAQLKEMWEKELQAIQVAASVVSMESMGRSVFNSADFQNYDFVLVDESHNFRNSNQRYAALSRVMGAGRSKKMALLTATPINNSVFDLYNQIMLFVRGRERYFTRAGIPHLRSYFIRALEDGDLLNLLEEIMVRRTRHFVKQEFPEAVINGEPVRFPERKLHTEHYNLEALHTGIYKKVAKLFENLGLEVYNPEKFLKNPTVKEENERQRNEALIGLIKSLLLKRFESSVEAFRISIERQVDFHKRFIEELVENQRLLSSADYRRALATESEEEAATLLQNLPTVEASVYRTQELARVVEKDLGLLREMAQLVEPITIEKDPKISKLLELIEARPGKKIVVFSYFQDTIRYLEDAFRGAFAERLRAVRWEVVDGRVGPNQRTAILRRFAPKSQKANVSPGDEIDLLLATDVFSEGQNLQDADTLINFDLHWNPTRMIQRAGRIDRLGSPFEVIHVHNFYPEEGLEEILGLLRRLMEKIAQIDKNVGLDASILGETINPKTFNALRRIEQEDIKIADELEAEAEISSEFMRLVLSKYLQKAGTEQLEAIPLGVHSGKQAKPMSRKGIFFHFRVRGEHIWRFYDVEKEEILDSKYRIYKLIECEEDTPRVNADFQVDKVLEKVQRNLLEELNLQNAVNIDQMPKVQREVISALRGLAKHPQIDRQGLIELLKVLNQPLSRVMLAEVGEIYKRCAKSDVELFQTLKHFSERYELEKSLAEVQAGPVITEDDLELVVYMTVS